MDAEHHSYSPSPTMTFFPDDLRSSPITVSRSLPKIIPYLLLVELSIGNFHGIILFALNSDRHKFMFTFFDIVNFPALVSHLDINDFFV